MKYIYKHGNQFWYQRAIPESIYKIIGVKSIKISLKTNKISTAIKRSKIQALEHQKMFKYFKKKSNSYIEKFFSKTTKNIKKYEIKFLDDYEDLVAKLVFSKSKYLNDLKTTLNLNNKNQPTLENFLFENIPDQFPLLSESLELLNNKNFVIKNRSIYRSLISEFLKICDDKTINEYNENDAATLYNYFVKTNNIQFGKKIIKNLDCYFASLFKYFSLNKEVFLNSIKFKTNSTRAEKFSEAELHDLKENCLNNKDFTNFIIAMLFNTGCSFKELIGLESNDVNLDKINPFIIIRSNFNRTITNINKIRTIPLIGLSRWGANNIFQDKKKSLLKDFKNNKRLIKHNESQVNKRIKSFSNKKTISSFRLSIINRLVQVECPEEVILEIIGNSKKNRLYRREISLELKSSWLKQIDF